MDKRFTITTAAYVLILLGCTFAFYVQQHVIVNDHIRPGLENAGKPIAAVVTPKVATGSNEVSVRFLDSSPLTNPLRMGSEMQEQLQAVLFANLATAAYLILGHARRKSLDA